MVTDHKHGGYSMDDNEIGVFISIVAVVQLFFQVKRRLAKALSHQKLLFCSYLSMFPDLYYTTALKKLGNYDAVSF